MTNMEDKVRTEIVNSAEKVFETYGFARVSMQDISKSCGKGRTTLYHYFGNKGEVFDAVAEKICGEILKQCEEVLNPNATLSVNVENFLRKKLQKIRYLSKKYKLVLDDLKEDPAELMTKLRVQLSEENVIIYRIIQWSIARKEISYLDEDNSRFLAEVIVTAFKSLEQEIVFFDRFPDLENRLKWLSTIIFKGLQ